MLPGAELDGFRVGVDGGEHGVRGRRLPGFGVEVNRIPTAVLRLAGLAVPMLRELPEMLYQFDEPFEIDATDTTETFGLSATPLDDQLRATIAAYRDRPAVTA